LLKGEFAVKSRRRHHSSV